MDSHSDSLAARIPASARGGVLLACGVSVFGVTDSLTLLVSDMVGVGQFHFCRALLAAAILWGVARLTNTSVMPKIWWAVGLRTFFITTSIMLFFSVLPLMPIAEAGAGLFTSPIFVLLFSRTLFGERIDLGRIMAVVIGSIGVLLVLKPGGDGFTFYHLIPVLAGMFYALNSITTYRYCGQESPMALSLAFFLAIGAAGALLASALTVLPVPSELYQQAPFMFRGWAGVDGAFWLTVLGIAMAAVGAIVMINKAYQTTQTSYVIVYEYTYLIAAGMTGWLVWGAVPDALSVVGIIFIIASGVVIARAQKVSLRSVAGPQE